MSIKSILSISNVKCANCVSKIESRINRISGVINARVHLLDKTLHLTYESRNLDKIVADQLRQLGYPVNQETMLSHKKGLITIILPLVTGILFMLWGMFPDYINLAITNSSRTDGLIYSILSLGIIVSCGYDVIKSGLQGFRTLNPNMYSLIIVGVFSAWSYSTFTLVANAHIHSMSMQHSYFESSLIIIGLVNLGYLLEEKAKISASESLRQLAELLPETATLIKEDKEQIIAVNQLRISDLVKVKPGERLPADGVIANGDGFLDEAVLSGEPFPLYKKVGDNVFGGSINTGGSFIFSVSRVGSSTLLGDIVQLVKSAQLAKPRLSRLADRVAKFFTPIVILIAIGSGLLWYFLAPVDPVGHAVRVFMTVLIIACPCSVGLAIPVSLAVGVGRAARAGIIIRDPSGLDAIDYISTVVIDKTGTITQGKPRVAGVEVIDGYEEEYVFRLLKSLEAGSEHPLARAIIDFTLPDMKASLDVQNFQSYSGLGVAGIINNVKYYAGSLAFIQDKINFGCLLANNNHYTKIYLANEQQIIARVDISDPPKVDSASAISKFHDAGFEVIMLTGDNLHNANFIAKQVGVNKVIADCLPGDKVHKIIELQQNGAKVLFIGDGVNDAPSLAQANLGIAVGNACDIAKQNASISLLGDSLLDVSKAITLAKKIKQNMHQNLFGAFIYNTIAIIIAAGGLYPFWHILLDPMLACITMSLSSLTVIMNALRLKFEKISDT